MINYIIKDNRLITEYGSVKLSSEPNKKEINEILTKLVGKPKQIGDLFKLEDSTYTKNISCINNVNYKKGTNIKVICTYSTKEIRG